MNIKIGDYLITSDERQFIVKAKRVVEESKLTKAENIGKEYYQAIAYCTNFNSALKFIPQQVLRSEHDILVIKEKLNKIDEDIKAFRNSINLENILVPKEEYEELVEDSKKLSCLEGAGVDNWEGYSEAMEYMEEQNNE